MYIYILYAFYMRPHLLQMKAATLFVGFPSSDFSTCTPSPGELVACWDIPVEDTGRGFCRWYSWENRLADGFSHYVKFRLPSDIMEVSDYLRLSHAITQSGRFDSLLLRLPLESRPLWPVSPCDGETQKPGNRVKQPRLSLLFYRIIPY